MLDNSFNAPGEDALSRVFDIILGPVRMEVLRMALDLDVADLVAEDGGEQALRARLGAENGGQNLIRFLDAMAAMGLLEKNGGSYANTPFAEAHLRRDSPTYLGGLVANIARMEHRNLGRMAELIRTGPPDAVREEERLDTEDRWKNSVRHLASYQKSGVAHRVADIVAGLPEYPALRRVLDLGGGPGFMGMAIVGSRPDLSGVLCELPRVAELAQEEIRQAGMQERVTVIAGDYNEADLGRGYDLVWASQTLYFAKDLPALCEKIHAALNPDGVFLSLHEGLTRERTRPESLVLSRLSLALEGQDTCFDHGTIAQALRQAGFSSVHSAPCHLPGGEQELVTAKKGPGS